MIQIYILKHVNCSHDERAHYRFQVRLVYSNYDKLKGN